MARIILGDIETLKLNKRLKRYTPFRIVYRQVEEDSFIAYADSWRIADKNCRFPEKCNIIPISRDDVEKLIQQYILKENLRLLFIGRYKNPKSPFCKNRLPLDIFISIIEEYKKEIKSVRKEVKSIQQRNI